MLYLNYALCVMLMAFLIVVLWFILRRNRRITVGGKDDFLTGMLAMLALLLLLPLTEHATLVESLRNTLLLAAMFSTMAVRRGLSDRGVEKLFFTIPWSRVGEVRLAPYQMTRVQAVFFAGSWRFKLYFPKHRLKDIVFELQKHTDKVYLHESIGSGV